MISKLDDVFRGNHDSDKDVHRSRLRHLLESNTSPSDSEVVAIRALINDAEAWIEEFHRCFPADDNNASQVQVESQLLKTIEEHRALLSPVRFLPTEILQEIFLRYALADNPGTSMQVYEMPWRLGHICHRWRKIALSLPSLWDNIRINILIKKPKRSYVRALVCLIQRSGTSSTLKFDIGGPLRLSGSLKKVHKGPIIKQIIRHSKRIEQLRIDVNDMTVPLYQGFKGRLPNLRVLRVLYVRHGLNEPERRLDVFQTAPALRQVAIGGLYQDSRVRVLFPWSQITHFEDQLEAKRVENLVPLSSLRSLTYLDIYKTPCFIDESALLPYQPTTLPNLHTLRVIIDNDDFKNVDLFLKSLTIPAVEVMKISYMKRFIPHLVSMFSGSHGPSRLQKLAFRTNRLYTGELSSLLNLTPHLVELDIDVPPTDDLLKLTYGEGGVMLVPMLQSLYIHIHHSQVFDNFLDALNKSCYALAQVRCELGIPSLELGTWTILHTLRFYYDNAQDRDRSQHILNNWVRGSFFTLEELKTITMIRERPGRNCQCNPDSFVRDILACIENNLNQVTIKVLHVGDVCMWNFHTKFIFIIIILQETNLHIDLRHVLVKLPDQNESKQRAVGILTEWDQLLLNDLSSYRWARTSELCDFSLVYVSKSKSHGERHCISIPPPSPN